MAAFSFTNVSKSNGVTIMWANPKKGDAHPFDVPATGWNCFTFAVKGSCKVITQEGVIHSQYPALSLPAIDDLIGEPFVVLAETAMEYYCISGYSRGEVHKLSAGGSLTLNDMQGKRVFLATASATINGVEADKHKVCFFQNSNEATITAPTNSELVFAVFYNPEELTQ